MQKIIILDEIEETFNTQPQSEVEYANELQKYWEEVAFEGEWEGISYCKYRKIARHFYELGLKANKERHS